MARANQTRFERTLTVIKAYRHIGMHKKGRYAERQRPSKLRPTTRKSADLLKEKRQQASIGRFATTRPEMARVVKGPR